MTLSHRMKPNINLNITSRGAGIATTPPSGPSLVGGGKRKTAHELDEARIAQALALGWTYAQAAWYAGSQAKTVFTAAAQIMKVLKRKPWLKGDVINKLSEVRYLALNEVRERLIDGVKRGKIGTEDLIRLVDKFTKRIELLSGRPTDRFDLNTLISAIILDAREQGDKLPIYEQPLGGIEGVVEKQEVEVEQSILD